MNCSVVLLAGVYVQDWNLLLQDAGEPCHAYVSYSLLGAMGPEAEVEEEEEEVEEEEVMGDPMIPTPLNSPRSLHSPCTWGTFPTILSLGTWMRYLRISRFVVSCFCGHFFKDSLHSNLVSLYR